MGKGKNFVGQPILSQVLNCIPKSIIREAVTKHQADRYYKKIPTHTHLTSLLYGVLSGCSGLREICEGMLACEGRLGHLGLEKAPPRSTFSDANNNRSYLVFESIYYRLVQQYLSFISDSRLKGLSIRNLRIIDSTTIRLFSDILKGVGRNPLDGAKKKGGFKVHAMMDAFSGIVEFVRMTEAKVHDRKFLRGLNLKPNSWIVFDKAYNVYQHYAKWTSQQVWFVTRMKENAVYHVTKVLLDNTKKKNPSGVLKVQLVTIGYKSTTGNIERLKLRRIEYKTEEGKILVFITNNHTIQPKQIAVIYKTRWMIELLFKQFKQNFPLKYFWGASENAIKTQVYSVLIAQLLMVVIRKTSDTKKSFSNMITVIRLHLTSYVNINEFMKDTYQAWRLRNAPELFSP